MPGSGAQPPSSPVRWIPPDDPPQPPAPGIALCLSGGGYRAMLFHLGALWRLNELGYLPQLERVSSVSGGSITAAVLGLNWTRLAVDPVSGAGAAFHRAGGQPNRALAADTNLLPAVLKG